MRSRVLNSASATSPLNRSDSVSSRRTGGSKSLEIRRFGFTLDHGGVNGGLKILVDDVQQNQGTQGHGQGYLGALKVLSPELKHSGPVLTASLPR